MNQNTLESALKLYEREQCEFENHWLWKELKITPNEFFKQVNQHIQESGIDQQTWQKKLAEAKRALEIRLREQKNQYQRVNLKLMGAIRA